MNLKDHIKDQLSKKILHEDIFLNTNFLILGEPNTGKKNFIMWFLETQNVEWELVSDENELLKVELCGVTLKNDRIIIRNNIHLISNIGKMIDNSLCAPLIANYIKDNLKVNLENKFILNDVGIDKRIHLMIYFARSDVTGLAPLDIEILKKTSKIVNICLVMGKSDSLSEEEKFEAKKLVAKQLKEEDISLFKRNDGKYSEPFFIYTAPTRLINDKTTKIKGREYPWGMANMFEESYNDYNKLHRGILENLHELSNSTEEIFNKYQQKYMTKLKKFFQDSKSDENENTESSIYIYIELIDRITEDNEMMKNKLKIDLAEIKDKHKQELYKTKKNNSDLINELKIKLETKKNSLEIEQERKHNKKKLGIKKFI